MRRDTISLELCSLLTQKSRFFDQLLAAIRAFLGDPWFDHLQSMAFQGSTRATIMNWFSVSLDSSVVESVTKAERQSSRIGLKVRVGAQIIALVKFDADSGLSSEQTVIIIRNQYGGTIGASQHSVAASFDDFETR